VRPQPTLGTVEIRIMDAQSTLGAMAALVALVDPVRGRAVSVLESAGELMSACAPHAAVLGCNAQLDLLAELLDQPGPARQRALAARDGLDALAADLALEFRAPLPELQPDAA
jgi:carboxylate-amine ligase